MTPAYADSSFIISLLVEDGNTQAALCLMERNPETLAFNPLHRLEVRNGLRLRVFRGEIGQKARAEAIRKIESGLETGLFTYVPLPWTNALRQAEHLSEDHAERIGSRAADTLHIAAAMLVKSQRFLSFDKRQRDLARAAGMEVAP